MYTIRVRRRQKFYIFSLFFCLLISYYFFRWAYETFLRVYELDDTMEGPCNKRLNWASPGQPVIGLLGAPESGILWLRFLVEQMSGTYTGSVENMYGDEFKAEAKTERVVAVLAHDMHKLEGMQAGIVLYRNMKDTIRAQYAKKQGRGAFLEAPLRAYYGKDWPNFVLTAAEAWAETYKVYLESGVPILIMGYEELHDQDQLRTQLLRISNFLHVPIRASVFECILEKFQETESKPKPLKAGFQPFDLLPGETLQKLDDIENKVQHSIEESRDKFRPKVR